MTPRPNHSFTTLAGVQCNYDRLPDAPYGSHGKPFTFYCTQSFNDVLAAAFAELWMRCPFGQAQLITSAGTWVAPKPGEKPQMHQQGRAFDLDGIFWDQHVFLSAHYPIMQPFYLAVEAIMKKHFGVVLNYLYNPAHHDHMHIDDTDAPGFSVKARSEVLFVQAALTYIYDLPVVIDGLYGPQTKGALHKAFLALGMAGPIELISVWLKFLTQTAMLGFAHVNHSEG